MILVVKDSQKPDMLAFINDMYKGKLSIDLVSINDVKGGAITALREIKDKIKVCLFAVYDIFSFRTDLTLHRRTSFC